MRKIILVFIFLIFIVIIGGFFLFKSSVGESGCVINDLRQTPVSLDLAKSVASDQVQRNNPPFDWVYVGNYVVYNSFGDTNYYIIIFRKIEFTKFDTLAKLEQNAKLFSDSTSEESDNKYQFNDIVATVMTGTMKEDKLIQRHFRGIPESIGKRLEIKEFIESNYPGKTIGNLIFDSPMDVGFYEIISKSLGESSGDLIRVLDKSIVSLRQLKQNQEDIQKRKQQRYSTYEDEECERYKQAAVDAMNANINQWNEFE